MSPVSAPALKLDFEMPRVEIGQVVAWYPTGIKKDRVPEIAHVIRTASRNIHVITATRGVREAVRHVDDPKLKLNADQRETGAWDFTDAERARRKEQQQLMDRLASMQKQLDSVIQKLLSEPESPSTSHSPEASSEKESAPAKKKKKRGGGGLSSYFQLRQRVADMGVEMKGHPSKEWLLSKLNELGESGEDNGSPSESDL